MSIIVLGHVSSSVIGNDFLFYKHYLDIFGFDLWGSLCTGVFFFLSGYGMFLSLRRNIPVKYSYLRKKLAKLFEPFFFMWLFYLLLMILFDRNNVTGQLVIDFITISFPLGIDAWFFKVILAFYFFIWLVFKISFSDSKRVFIITFLTIVYFILFRTLGFGPWWINSVFCFPLGMLYAWQYERLAKNFLYSFIIILTTMIGWIFTTISFFPSLCFSLIVVYTIRYINISRIPVLSFIGVNSLFFYFLEEPVYNYITNCFSDNFFIYYVSTMLVIICLVKLYLSVSYKYKQML